MATLGIIKEIRITDGQLKAIVETGSGEAVTATVMQAGTVDYYPLPGDRVLYHYAGQEVVVSAIFSEDNSVALGEILLFSRDAAGVVQATFHLKADGLTVVGQGLDFVAMAAKVNAMFALIDSIITTWVPVANDGGAALQTLWSTAYPAGKQDVDSANLKAD